MTDAQWKRVLEIYETLCDSPKPKAQARLTRMSEEPAVLREVAEMLRTGYEPQRPAESEKPARYTGAVIGRYEVLELLGRGSTAEVYSGRDRELGRPVALKIMATEGASDDAGRQFLREAQAASALNHPNIVTVHEVIASNSPPIIVMELVEGKSLRILCRQSLSLAQAHQIGLQMVQALAFAHSSGIVHRDLKPENVMVRPDGYTKVLDFGLARRSFLDEASDGLSSTTGLPVGTLRYMSPEQCRGEPAKPASDVFAAGIVLYELFVGRHPFQFDSPLDAAHAIAWEKPQPPRYWNKDVPASVESLILRMLAKDPAMRPSSTEAAAALAVGQTDGVSLAKGRRLYGLAALVSILAVGSMGGLLFTRGTRRVSPHTGVPDANLEIVPVAGLPGDERMPSLSADGTKVAFEFTSTSDPVSHIYLKDLTASTPVILTKDKLPDFKPAFSRDGTKIAFLRRDRGRMRVMVMPSTPGAIETQVGEVGDVAPRLQVMTWDAPGTTLIVSDGLAKPEDPIALFAIPVGGGGRQQITFPEAKRIDCMPLVSPDGLTLGFARLTLHGVGQIWAIPLADSLSSPNGKKLRPLTEAAQFVATWAWASDGRNLLIARAKGARTSLWRQPLGENAAERVPGIDDQVAQLSVSLTDNRLVYAPTAPGNVSLWLYRTSVASEAPRQLISSDRLDVDARYSPDGRNIAFASMRDGDMSLWICSKDGSNARKAAFFGEEQGYTAGSPNWSPDGRWIAFDTGGGERTGIYTLDILGGKPRRLTGPGSTDSVPAWSADGRWIYYSSDRGGLQNIWKVPASGGAPIQVTRNTGFECTLSPDGKHLYYTRFKGAPGIWRISLASGEDQLIPGLESVTTRCWQGSSQGIYFMAAGTPAVLKFFDFSTQNTTVIRTMPVQPIPVYRGLSVAPDGRSVLYAQAEKGRSNIMLVKNFR